MMSNYIIAGNKYGKFCVPSTSKNRPAARAILRGHVWEPDTIEFIVSRCNSDLVHAGTYFGDFLPAFSSINNVWAFEPNKENYNCAQETIKLNHIQNVHLTNAGLGATMTTASLQTKKDGKYLGGGSIITDLNISADDLAETINICTIDESVPTTNNVSIIQLDVEGYELNALRGAVKTIERCSPILILEMNLANMAPDLLQFLENLNYSMTGTLHNANAIWKMK